MARAGMMGEVDKKISAHTADVGGEASGADPLVGLDEAPPMTKTLLARLFVVPAILVSILVLSLMTVVILFGWPGIGQRPSAEELLKRMEQGSGQRTLGMVLLPQDKDVWLAAQELAERLKQRDKEFKPTEIGPAAEQLNRLYERTVAADPLNDDQRRFAGFTLMALARLDTARSIDTLIAALHAKDSEIRLMALRGLAEVRQDPAVQRAAPDVAELLNDPVREVQLFACATLGQIAPKGDASAISALEGKLGDENEARWNAALAIGRLGSARSKLVLMSMMDRAQWQRASVRYTDQDKHDVERPVSQDLMAGRITDYMVAAIDAAARVKDADLREAIEKLKSDPSPVVRQHAIEALKAAS